MDQPGAEGIGGVDAHGVVEDVENIPFGLGAIGVVCFVVGRDRRVFRS